MSDIELNQQLRLELEKSGLSPEDAIKCAVKLLDDCNQSDGIYYKNFTITSHNGQWVFDDDTKYMVFCDVDLLNGLLVADKIREQGL